MLMQNLLQFLLEWTSSPYLPQTNAAFTRGMASRGEKVQLMASIFSTTQSSTSPPPSQKKWQRQKQFPGPLSVLLIFLTQFNIAPEPHVPARHTYHSCRMSRTRDKDTKGGSLLNWIPPTRQHPYCSHHFRWNELFSGACGWPWVSSFGGITKKSLLVNTSLASFESTLGWQ